MSIDFLAKKEKQTKLIIIFALVLTVTIVVIVKGLVGNKSDIDDAMMGVISGDTAINSQEINIDLTVFDNPIFKKLETFEKIAPLEGDSGRINPFLPY